MIYRIAIGYTLEALEKDVIETCEEYGLKPFGSIIIAPELNGYKFAQALVPKD